MKQIHIGNIVCAGLIAACLLGCQKPPATSFSMPPPQVTVAKAITRDVPEYLDEIGKCTAQGSGIDCAAG